MNRREFAQLFGIASAAITTGFLKPEDLKPEDLSKIVEVSPEVTVPVNNHYTVAQYCYDRMEASDLAPFFRCFEWKEHPSNQAYDGWKCVRYNVDIDKIDLIGRSDKYLIVSHETERVLAQKMHESLTEAFTSKTRKTRGIITPYSLEKLATGYEHVFLNQDDYRSLYNYMLERPGSTAFNIYNNEMSKVILALTYKDQMVWVHPLTHLKPGVGYAFKEDTKIHYPESMNFVEDIYKGFSYQEWGPLDDRIVERHIIASMFGMSKHSIEFPFHAS